MPRLDIKRRWIIAAVLLCGTFVQDSTCESSGDCVTGTKVTCEQKHVLVVSAKTAEKTQFPSEAIYSETNGNKLCFDIQNNKTGCGGDFNYSFKIHSTNHYSLILNEEILSKHNVILMFSPDQNRPDGPCAPSHIYEGTGFLNKIHNCFKKGVKNVRLSLCRNTSSYDKEACKGLAETDYKFTINESNNEVHCVSCKCLSSQCSNGTMSLPTPGSSNGAGISPEVTMSLPTPGSSNGAGISPEVTMSLPTPGSSNGAGISPESAANIMKNISSVLEQMEECSTANIIMGNIEGKIWKLPSENQTSINFDFTTSGEINDDSVKSFSRLVRIPVEAVAMAEEANGSFVAVLLFPGMYQDDPSSSFLNNEVMGIEMGTEIANLSDTIDIHYRNVDKNGSIASCRSWSGEGQEATWIRDGCETEETADTITCRCSHLTFFAILMSPPPGNVSSSDFQALTHITSIGCGLSMFFLMVGLFMHCLIRKGKGSQATKILMNLFVAMLTLNLSFLVNESIAKLGVFGACVAVAAVMHYTLLATFTWFFMQALHLYLNLMRLPIDRRKICAAGWVTPAVVVIILAALSQYDYLAINVDDGNSAKMCFISNAAVHQGVNVGYYSVVFIFTFTVLVMTVRQILLLQPAAGKANDNSHIKKNSFSILCLLLLLGITWAFAFFSHGPLLITSYYIFTILNSLQGFFLFIYYYSSREVVAEDTTVSRSSSATLNSSSSGCMVTGP